MRLFLQWFWFFQDTLQEAPVRHNDLFYGLMYGSFIRSLWKALHHQDAERAYHRIQVVMDVRYILDRAHVDLGENLDHPWVERMLVIFLPWVDGVALVYTPLQSHQSIQIGL
jgi:hypothetical protein